MVGADKSRLELSECYEFQVVDDWCRQVQFRIIRLFFGDLRSRVLLSSVDPTLLVFFEFSSSCLRVFQCFRDAPCFLVFRGHCAKLRQLAVIALRVFVDVSGVFASFLRVVEFVCVFLLS